MMILPQLLGVLMGMLLALLINHSLLLFAFSSSSSLSHSLKSPARDRSAFAIAHSQPLPQHDRSSSSSAGHVPKVDPMRIKIACWVALRTPEDLERSMIVESWFDECDATVFLSRVGNESLLVRAHNYTIENKHDLWNIVHRGLYFHPTFSFNSVDKYIKKKLTTTGSAWALMYTSPEFFPKFDYYIKVDSDTYFSGLNFKHLVRNLNPDEPQYIGWFRNFLFHCVFTFLFFAAQLTSKPDISGHLDYHKAPHRFNLGMSIAVSRGFFFALFLRSRANLDLPANLSWHLAKGTLRALGWCLFFFTMARFFRLFATVHPY